MSTSRRKQLFAVVLGCLAVAGASAASMLVIDGQRSSEPEPNTEIDSTDTGEPYCQQLTVPVRTRERTSTWTWDDEADEWTETWGEWSDPLDTMRAATAEDCLKILDQVPTQAALPDLQLKELYRCGEGDKQATGGDCFTIVNPGPYVKAFPELEGKKLLVFPMIILNTGYGPSEIIGDRTAEDAEDWKAYQTFYTAQGERLGSVLAPGVEFYFAGDEHNHWHIRDFDDYALLDARDDQVRVAEKHGYCQQDNTTYDTMTGWHGVPPEPGVYLESTSCGEGLPAALTIIHGLSRGWGDTYPTSLPDQAIDITGVPDGTYTVQVWADSRSAVVESDEDNNVTSMQVTITGDEVTTHPKTSVGGVH